MGYYECPRCGSSESYLGNELVAGSVSSGSVGMVNSEGVSMHRSLGSSLRHKQVKVVKCRECGEILGEDDYYLTDEEIRERERIEKEERLKRHRNLIIFGKVCAAGVVIFTIYIGVEALKEKIEKSRLAKTQEEYRQWAADNQANLEAVAQAKADDEAFRKAERQAALERERARQKEEKLALEAFEDRMSRARQKEDLLWEWAFLPPGKKFIYTLNDGNPKTDISIVYLNQLEEVLIKAFGEPDEKYNRNSFAYYIFKGIPIKTTRPTFSLSTDRYAVIFKMRLNTEAKWVVAGIERVAYLGQFTPPSEFLAPVF